MVSESFLSELEKSLEGLEIGQALDVSDISLEEADKIRGLYGEKYEIRGPVHDDENPGNYVVELYLSKSNKIGDLKNA